jgi:uncharacterized membrane protein SpoIIM required for sporulation
VKIKNNPFYIQIFILIGVFLFSTIVGIYSGYNFHFQSLTNIQSNNVGLHGILAYFLHNGLLLLLPLASVFLIGIIAPVFLISQAIVIGIFIGVSLYNGLSIVDILIRISHGMFEIPAMILATWIGTFYTFKYDESIIIFWNKIRKKVLITYLLIGTAAIYESF